MEQNIIIYIGIWKVLSIIGVVITSVVIGTWKAASKLTSLETKVDGFEKRLTGLEGRLLDNAFGNASPISLLPKGQTILDESGLKKYIDDRKNDLLSQCKNTNVMKNPYDIQEASFKFFDQFNFGDFETNLKNSAYKNGVSIETIRRIAGIYFRDICLKAHGFSPEDLDKLKS
mgnify:CR=1 FL=1